MKIQLHEIGRADEVVRFRVENDERPKNWNYTARNGITLCLKGCPEWCSWSRVMFLQGVRRELDNAICIATPTRYAEIQAAVAESNAANATHEPEPDRVAVLTERVSQLEARLAALEAANDPVQDDAGSGDKQIEINCQPPCVECGVCNGHSPGCGSSPQQPPATEPVPKQPRFVRDGNRVIDNEQNLQTWFAAEDIAESALVDFVSGGQLSNVSWELIEPDQPPVPEQPKRRRVWIDRYPYNWGRAYSSASDARKESAYNCLEQVEFIEVLPGDGDVFAELAELHETAKRLRAERNVLWEQMERFAAAGYDRPEWADTAHYAEQAIWQADKAKEMNDE